MRTLVCLILIFSSLAGFCQMKQQQVLARIDSLQIYSDPFYSSGLFPTQRSWNLSKNPVEDNTIFFTASIVQTLQSIAPSLDLTSSFRVDAITKKARENYFLYRSRNKEPTFNFWQTVAPDLPFPNGNRWISNAKMRLPDDLDTSVILAMSTENDTLKARLRANMISYAGREDRDEAVRNTLEKYENSLAYEAWFAKDMPQTFDICVLSNALLFVLTEGYPLNEHDLASADLIGQMILDGDLKTDEIGYLSHHTASLAVIYYHVARLLEVDREGLMDASKPTVINELVRLQSTSETEVEKMLVQTSLLRLGIFPSVELDYDKLEAELEDFVFFSVKPFLGNPQLAFLEAVVSDISWRCPAYSWTLYLEHLHFKRSYTANLPAASE